MAITALYTAGINYRKTSYVLILNMVHQAYRTRYENLKQEQRAKQMQDALSRIKHVAKQLSSNRTSSPTINLINYGLVDLINQAWLLQQKTGTNTNKSFFYNSKDSAHMIGTDDILEQELAFLFAALENPGFATTTNIPLILEGQKNVTSLSLQSPELKHLEQGILKGIRQAVKKSRDSKQKLSNHAESLIGKKIVVRQGKIDLNAPSYSIAGDVSEDIDELKRIFSQATFSVKNMSSLYQQGKNKGKKKTAGKVKIGIGNTNFYKSIIAPLDSLFGNSSISNIIYFRGMQHLRGTARDNSAEKVDATNRHFAHLRFYYELRGQGMIDAKNTSISRAADFLIYNDPDSEMIVVRSTMALILQIADTFSNPFQDMTLSLKQIL